MKRGENLSGTHLEILQQQAAMGNETAFKEIYLHFYKKLYQFALAIIKTKETAEEIVEDVFVKIWQQKANLAGVHNLRVYLYTATKNTSLNYLSKKAKDNITDPFDYINIELSESALNPEQILITTEMFNKIQRAVEALPPRCKMIFKLVREDGLKYKEVSDILHISVNTIDVQMAIAVKRIAVALKFELDYIPIRKPSLK